MYPYTPEQVTQILLLRRGVRSDTQLSCTETRFQKCSQSGKNGSKHPMLSLSMAYNVIKIKPKWSTPPLPKKAELKHLIYDHCSVDDKVVH